jgi:hypothetical protein
MWAILLVHVDQNVYSIRIVLVTKVVLETVALILVWELVAITQSAGYLIMFPYAAVKKITQGIPMDLAVQFL